MRSSRRLAAAPRRSSARLPAPGTIALENAQLASLNPRVFDAVIRAVDLGIPTDAKRIRDFVTTALENGTLPAPRIEAAIAVAAGQARLSKSSRRKPTAPTFRPPRMSIWSRARSTQSLTLAGTPAQSGGSRPTLSITLKGPWNAPSRTIDAGALASWLSLRAVEQQAKQVDTMEQQQRSGSANGNACCVKRTYRCLRPCRRRLRRPSSPEPGGDASNGLPGNAAPPLPPAINVLPVPKPRAGRGRVRRDCAAAPSCAGASRGSAKPAPPVYPPLDLLGAQN